MARRRRSSTAISRAKRALAGAALLGLPGCLAGGFFHLYQNTVEPLTKNLDRTPYGAKSAGLDVKEFRLPVAQLNPRVQWASNAIGDIAAMHGITKIYFADLETFSLFFGLWRQETVRIRGD